MVAADVAPGTITLDLISPRTGGDYYWRYLVTPTRGQVVQSQRGRQAVDQWPASRYLNEADCFKGEDIVSPDHLFIARCSGEEPRKAAKITITDVKTGQIVVHWMPTEWRGIDSLAWSPTSRSLAIANYSERYGTGIFDRVWAWAGHPVPYHTFYVQIADVQNKTITEYTIGKDVVMGSARILDWSPRP